MPDIEEVSDSEEEKKDEDEDEEEEKKKKEEKKKEKPEEEEEDEPAERDADGWLDLMNGKIKVKTLKAGSGRNPEMKESARCSVEIYLVGEMDTGKPLVRHPEIRYVIGEHEAVPMLELSLRHMQEGEEAEVFGMPAMAWGSEGLKAASPEEQDVPGDVNIKMRVTLIEVISVSDEELPWNELINSVSWRKFNGNDHFKRKDFKKAENCYKNGIEVFGGGYNPPETMREADRPQAVAMAMNMVCDLGSNLAQVYLEIDEPVKAKETALASLETRPEHLKCLFRAAKACFLLDDFDECEGLLARGFKLESENAALKKVEADLNKKKRKYEAKSKRIAETNLFGELEYPDLVTEKAVKEAREDYEETWSFWIKKEMETWFSKKIITVVVAFCMLLVVALMVLPKRYWPIGLIGFVMGLPMTIGVVTATDDEKTEKEKEEKKKQKKKKR